MNFNFVHMLPTFEYVLADLRVVKTKDQHWEYSFSGPLSIFYLNCRQTYLKAKGPFIMIITIIIMIGAVYYYYYYCYYYYYYYYNGVLFTIIFKVNSLKRVSSIKIYI